MRGPIETDEPPDLDAVAMAAVEGRAEHHRVQARKPRRVE